MSTPLNQPTTTQNTIINTTPSSLPAQDSTVKTWHHDCSNTSGFYDVITLDFSLIAHRDYWSGTEGNYESDGQSLYLRNITEPIVTNPDFYGPVLVYDLPDMFPVSGLKHFQARMEMNNSEPETVGAVAVTLFDEAFDPVLAAICRDKSSNHRHSFISWQYYPRNLSILDYFFEKDLNDYSLRGLDTSLNYVNLTWSASYTSDSEITGYIPSWGEMDTLDDAITAASDVEPARAIKYLTVMIGGYHEYEFHPISTSRIHDIYLEYEVGGVIDTSPPLLIPHSDVEYIFGQKGNSIEWFCTDDHPYRYWVSEFRHSYRYNLLNQETGPWNGSNFVISIDGLEIGYHVRYYMLIIQDKAGFMALDYVEVTVIEHPFITASKSVIQNPFFIGSVIFVTVLALAELDYRRSRKKRAQAYKSSEST
jgi:hypothetical protein